MDNKPQKINWSIAFAIMLVGIAGFILIAISPSWIVLLVGGFVAGIGFAFVLYVNGITPEIDDETTQSKKPLFQRIKQASYLRRATKRINIRLAQLKEDTNKPLQPRMSLFEQTDKPLS